MIKPIILSISVMLSQSFSTYAQGAFNSINLDLNAKLKATPNYNPRSTVDVITYKRSKTIPNAQYITIQKQFINSSGFPVVDANDGSLGKMNTMPKTFEEADLKYKTFKAKEINSPLIDVFERDAASLIIIRYLLDDAGKNAALQFYTEELLHSHSRNYGLLYLALNQLKPFVGDRKINQYKNEMHTDPVNIAHDKLMDSLQTSLADPSKPNTAKSTDALQEIVLKTMIIAKRRQSFYIHKIDSL
jgi:hypothetical protein